MNGDSGGEKRRKHKNNAEIFFLHSPKPCSSSVSKAPARAFVAEFILGMFKNHKARLTPRRWRFAAWCLPEASACHLYSLLPYTDFVAETSAEGVPMIRERCTLCDQPYHRRRGGGGLQGLQSATMQRDGH